MLTAAVPMHACRCCVCCPAGKLCIEVSSSSKLAWISEELCIGCGICVKVGSSSQQQPAKRRCRACSSCSVTAPISSHTSLLGMGLEDHPLTLMGMGLEDHPLITHANLMKDIDTAAVVEERSA